MKPKFTIITATYNAEKYLEESIKSVIDQDYSLFEYFIIDGESTDRTKEIVNKHSDSIDLFISEPDSGIYEAWNKGVKRASGDWILFIGSDDILINGALSMYASYIIGEDIKNTQFISSKCELISGSGDSIRIWGQAFKWKQFKWNFKVSHVAALHSKNLFVQYGNFDESYKIAGDYEFLLRAGKNLNSSFMNKITAKMRIVGVSNSSTLSYWEAIKAKSTTGKRNLLLCYLDALYIFSVVKIRLIFKS